MARKHGGTARATVVGRFAIGIVAVAAVVGIAAPAHAAYEAERQVSSPVTGVPGSWKPGPTVPAIAQSFRQSDAGTLASIALRLDIPGGIPASIALHRTSDPLQVSGELIATAGVVLSADGDWAMARFASRPVLDAGESYALVIDPHRQDDPTDTASFHLITSTSGPGDFSALQSDGAGGWGFVSWGSIVMEATFVDLYGETAAPTLAASTPCGIVPQVVLPDSEGITYTATYDEAAAAWQVDAAFDAGYLDGGDQVTQWTLPAAATACPPGRGSGAGDPAGSAQPGVGGLTELPATGSAPAPGVLVSGLALATGGVVMLVVDRIRRRPAPAP